MFFMLWIDLSELLLLKYEQNEKLLYDEEDMIFSYLLNLLYQINRINILYSINFITILNQNLFISIYINLLNINQI